MIGFIKYLRSEEAKNLQSCMSANHLLCVIAFRASRTGNPVKGIKQGEALIGDYKEVGMSRGQYRVALKNLKGWGYITTRTTNKGTIASLANNRVWDVNVKESDHQSNHQATIKQPSNNHYKECKKERKKEVYTQKEGFQEFPKVAKNNLGSKRKLAKKNSSDWTQLDVTLANYSFPSTFSDDLCEAILSYFRYMENKAGVNWGNISTIKAQMRHLNDFKLKYSDAEIIAALNHAELNGNTNYNPQWEINRKKRQEDEKKSSNSKQSIYERFGKIVSAGGDKNSNS